MSKQVPLTIEPEDYRQVVRLKLVLLAFLGFAVFSTACSASSP